jgi:chaperonin GroES
MKIKPLNDWAVIIPEEAETRTSGGLFIPDSAKEKPAEGVVEAIGPGAYEEERIGRQKGKGKKDRKFIPTTVKPGDWIIYEKYAGQRITIDDQERVLVRERSILGRLPERPKKAHEDPPPLRFPLVPAPSATKALVKRGDSPVALAHQHKVAAPKPAAKKAAAKPAKKAKKKTAKPAVTKRAAARPAKKAAKKTASRKPKKR